jgi:trk system potassium uptake protein TrkA
LKVAVAGAGKVGRYVAADLSQRGHHVVLIEQDQAVIDRYRDEIDCDWIRADACEPQDLADSGLDKCDVMIAATGDDEDNLVVSLLAKQEFGIGRVLARVNHPKNHWLFNEMWGVDIAVSPPHMLTSLVEEAVTVGDIVRLLTLERGKVSFVSFTLTANSPAVGRRISELELPGGCAVVGIVRSHHVLEPRPDIPLIDGDEVVALAPPEAEALLEEVLSGRHGGADRKPG